MPLAVKAPTKTWDTSGQRCGVVASIPISGPLPSFGRSPPSFRWCLLCPFHPCRGSSIRSGRKSSS